MVTEYKIRNKQASLRLKLSQRNGAKVPAPYSAYLNSFKALSLISLFKRAKLRYQWYSKPVSLEVVEATARLAVTTPYKILQAEALFQLNSLESQAAIDRLCAVWEESRHFSLGALLLGRGWVASEPPRLRVLTALKTERQLLSRSDPRVLQLLTEVSRTEIDLVLARRAVTWLDELVDRDELASAALPSWLSQPELGLNIDFLNYQEFIRKHKAGPGIIIALGIYRPELLLKSGPQLISPLLELVQTAHPLLASQARQVLLNLGEPETREKFCALALEPAQEMAREIVLEASYFPQEPHQRALFYFLTEQWEKYTGLDFDQSLLRFSYEQGDEILRHRIMQTARLAGRAELAGALIGARGGRNLTRLSFEEWGLVTDLLIKSQRLEEVWKLVLVAPPVWSARLLAKLASSRWQPGSKAEWAVFGELFKLAQTCEKMAPPLGRQLRPVLKLGSNTSPVNTLALSPDGQQVAVGRDDGTIQLWKLAAGQLTLSLGQELARPESEQGEPSGPLTRYVIKKLAFSPDGQSLVYQGGWLSATDKWQGYVQVIDLATKKRVALVDRHDFGDFNLQLAFSPDGRLFAFGRTNEIQLWRLPEGELKDRIKLKDTSGWVGGWGKNEERRLCEALAFSPDGKLLAIGTWDGRIFLWDLTEPKSPLAIKGRSFGEAIQSLTFNPEGTVLASGNSWGYIQLWNVPDGKQLDTIYGHYNGVYSLAFSPDGLRLASGHREVVRLWNAKITKSYLELTGLVPGLEKRPVKTAKGHLSEVTGLAFSPDGQYLISAGKDGRITLWSSRLVQKCYRTLEEAGIEDLLFARQAQRDPALPGAERNWLHFLEALMGQRFQHEIELDDSGTAPAEFDIEIES